MSVDPSVTEKRIDVSPALVQEWAEGTLEEWFPGYTASDAKRPQYKIVNVGSDLYKVEMGSRYEPGEPRVFRVTVRVEEI